VTGNVLPPESEPKLKTTFGKKAGFVARGWPSKRGRKGYGLKEFFVSFKLAFIGCLITDNLRLERLSGWWMFWLGSGFPTTNERPTVSCTAPASF